MVGRGLYALTAILFLGRGASERNAAPEAASLSTMPTIHSHFGCVAALVLTVLVARWVGIVSATGRIICSGGGCTDGSSANAYRYPTGYGCPTIDATTVNTAMMDANATNPYASSICEGVS